MSDEETKKMLVDWGFENLIPIFQENKIDMETLLILKREDITSEIIPAFGTRMKFIKYLHDHVNSNLIKTSPLYLHRSSSADTVILDSSACSSTGNLSEVETSASSTPIRDEATRQMELMDVNIENIFQRYSEEGKCIVAKHLENKKMMPFSDHEQGLLVSAVIRFATKHYLKPLLNNSSSTFDFLASKIVEAYPMELKETYYREPVHNEIGKRIRKAGGRLVAKYYNGNKVLERFGKSTKQRKQEYRNIFEEKKTCAVTINLDSEVSDGNYEEDKSFLKFHTQPWSTVEAKWESTSKRRLLEVYDKDVNSIDNLKVNEVMSNWPLIKHSQGYALLQIDFKVLYPDVDCNIFFKRWDEKRFALKKLMMEQIQTSVKKSLEPFLKTEYVEGEDGMLLSYISYLFKPRTLKCGSKVWRASTLEASKGFMSLVQNVSDVKHQIEERTKRLSQYNEPTQPSIVVVGESMDKITKSYVCIDEVTYERENILQAVDTCFQCLHAIGAKYDRESNRTWLLLQLYFYQIETAYDDEKNMDNTFANVKSVIRRLNYFDSLHKDMGKA